MSFFDTIRGRAAIQKVADREGKSYAEIEAAIQETINEVWGKPEFAEYQNTIFPEGKPTAAEFVGRMRRCVG